MLTNYQQSVGLKHNRITTSKKVLDVRKRTQAKTQAISSVFGVGVEQRQKLKSQVLDGIKGLDRGVEAGPEEQRRVESLVKQLERANPTPNPTSSPLINGTWKLVYTTSQNILGADRLPIFRPYGPIFQTIDAKKLKARNQETVPFFNGVESQLTVASKTKVNVQFKTFYIFGFIPFPASPLFKGFLDTTYLDEDLRISRGDLGNLFILTMEDPKATL